MSEEYRKGYKDGFKDGYEEGRKQGAIDTLTVPKRLDDYIFGQPSNSCSVCGRTWQPGVSYGYFCSNMNCPSTAKAYTISTTGQHSYATGPGQVGAVGSMSDPQAVAGANGPAGYTRPSTKEEQERLDRYNQVWINGSWYELGN